MTTATSSALKVDKHVRKPGDRPTGNSRRARTPKGFNDLLGALKHELDREARTLVQAGVIGPHNIRRLLKKKGDLATIVGAHARQYLASTSGKGTLRLIVQGSEPMILLGTDGVGVISQANHVFTKIDSDFDNDSDARAIDQTAPVEICPFELERQQTFAGMIESLDHPLDSLCFFQSQIVQFGQQYFGWIRREGKAVALMYRCGEGVYNIAVIDVLSAGLEIRRYPRTHMDMWRPGERRLIVPASAFVS